MMFGENVAKVKRGNVDRISELPEFILHNILSILDTREAGRASVLSKRWYQAWSSIPVLDFQYQHYKMEFMYTLSLMFAFDVSVGKHDKCFLEIIDRTMLRYDTHKYRIRKLYLTIPTPNDKIELLVDKWIRIAVQNQVEELFINCVTFCSYVTPNYRLPEILFRAKSLKVLDCRGIVLPYYETMELISLEYLTLDWVVESPLNMNVIALKKLRELNISSATITDDIVSDLLYGLVSLESLVLASCSLLKYIMISSFSLKQLRIEECLNIVKVTIDAPNLIEFWCNCKVETSLSLIRVLDNCNAQLSQSVDTMQDCITTDWLVKLKKFLEETNFFQSLVIKLPDCFEIKVDEDQLRNVVTGPPYKLRELKLQGEDFWDCTESPVTSLDALFLICHPDVMSITNLLGLSAEPILHIMKCKLPCWRLSQCWKWKHPLKSIELEGIKGSGLYSVQCGTECQFRLSWL